MKNLPYLILLFPHCIICNAQNLIPNGNFEQYSSCPSYWGQINYALFWDSPTYGTTDYYNLCAPPSQIGVPFNWGGYQQAHSGNAYSGITLRQSQNYREYLYVPLTSPLISGSCYQFMMYVNLPNNCNSTTADIGVYFSDIAISGISNDDPLPFVPQINNPLGFIMDTLNWTLISGNYTALGGESYIIIGNFKDDFNSAFFLVNPTGQDITYFYIDDVSLSICTGLDEQNLVKIKIYPSPCKDKLNVMINNNTTSELILYDITSRKLLQKYFINETTINTESLSKGVYIYELRTNNQTLQKGKILKQ